MFYSCTSDGIRSIVAIRFHTCEFPINDSLYLPVIAYHVKALLTGDEIRIRIGTTISILHVDIKFCAGIIYAYSI